ncbi:cold shock domain-containing protein [Arthrobacter sp. FB24]|uniref:cold shock domain-containing protein n=1 Tax=Arthrobacter sp. (strain FB24) TaxID=290399 RepID=UPI0022B45032|nr:cold shock domain-containing protein [Arthrobacter sp. FB24]
MDFSYGDLVSAQAAKTGSAGKLVIVFCITFAVMVAEINNSLLTGSLVSGRRRTPGHPDTNLRSPVRAGYLRESAENSMRRQADAIGAVLRFHAEKGLGIIVPDDGSEVVLLHYTSIVGVKYRVLRRN